MTRNILITGGAGFVGSALGIGLAQRYPDWKITALDNLKRRGSELNLPRLKQARIEFIHGDVRSSEDLDPLSLKPDLILECSAEPSVLAGYTSPGYVLQTNLVGTINCLELARQTQADFIFLSTSRIYPIDYLNSLKFTEEKTRFQLLEQQPLPGVSSHGISEDFPLDKARSLYGTTKLASELLIAEYGEAYGLRTLINRCGVLTGPWQMGKVDQGVFALWMAFHYFQKPLKYIGYGGTGKQVRDFLHVSDLLDLIDLQIHNLEKLKGQTFNVGGGVNNTLSLYETTQICQEITGNKVPITSIPETRIGDVPIFITDSHKVMNATGWQPKKDAKMTLTEIYEWIAKFEQQVSDIFN
ncbi:MULTISPECIES: NAD-dependent epimerase/dehydratase family protein [unclassified Tolypothrix]|uniref:NAD-dependent epimerase/dehydratase family protein n=1 Tax=unclassified Tolypothrix TaxID=2649714 RepID=UPI0005EABFCE|nr:MULTISPECIES: NAD-dependent epimerase/dehydratase family protein [unclassified Tolypothrix]BAY92058.1 NAD-dependent epimerase/dehydratase [Microchaete diplosiphon NIES-3275]EKF04745.1 NAD-binding domain 4 [Tolypothrix sp. PCC 7601]MBE9081737.1 NAD-dependent epimerase/dehydratase family protein [Tolypothrix sp. LEGE 11397]UYD26044.1 NAD-dependent epimerase/dehydratase family protein [Tolypothrix sp. PCC 7712]UYD31716.1 NAD-dependent epimerase/dehydratase family protein [Tolypothrix sp. PCC 7